jgi:hypothetical protein
LTGGFSLLFLAAAFCAGLGALLLSFWVSEPRQHNEVYSA